MENGQNMLQTVANTVENTMENERFELKTVAHTVEMAVSSSKMLQIAWKMVRTGNPKKIPQTKKKNPNNFLPYSKWYSRTNHDAGTLTYMKGWYVHGQACLWMYPTDTHIIMYIYIYNILYIYDIYTLFPPAGLWKLGRPPNF